MSGVVVLVAVLFLLSFLVVSNFKDKQAQKQRADTLQRSLDTLRSRAEKDRDFFELVRKLITTNNDSERNALLDELRNFEFTAPEPSSKPQKTTSSSTTTPATSRSPTTRATASTSTTSTSSTTSTTTTTPPSPSTTIVCVISRLVTTCV